MTINTFRSSARRQAAFTLIELLVVITIIGLLAALAFPAMNAALEAAKKAEAGAMVNQLKTAMVSYQTEYGVWPPSKASATGEFDGGDLYQMLIGKNDPSGDNPRLIVFMEFNKKSLRQGGNKVTDPSTADTFVDPWGNEYHMVLDTDYDNEVDAAGDTVNTSVAIWSEGKTGTQPDKYIKSW